MKVQHQHAIFTLSLLVTGAGFSHLVFNLRSNETQSHLEELCWLEVW